MLQTVRDVCQFDPKAIDYALSDQIESLEDLVGHEPGAAEAFFKKTYVTGGMRTLLRQGLQRLAGKTGQAVFELKQSMGGGKTHSMLALGYLGANPALAHLVPKEIVEGFTPTKARVVAISGRSVSRDKHLWGDIAQQLGKDQEFVEFYKGSPKAPNEADWQALIGDEPTLILLDELPPYFGYGVTQTVGAGTLADVTVYALSNLLSAALKLKRTCVVVSNLSGSYHDASRQIATLIQRAVGTLQQEAGRQAKSITPVELGSDEIYHILRTRLLLATPDEDVVDAAATAFSEAISDAVKSKTVAKSAEQIAGEIVASYPFHPSFKHILALFKDNERFRQTRGLMTLAAMMIRSVQGRKFNDVYLVGCQHIDLSQADIRDGLTNIYDLSGAIAHDIAGTGSEKGHAQIIDDQMGKDAASQVARLLLMASLPEANGAVKGLTKLQVVENLVAPHRSTIEFDEAFEQLRAECWYLHRRDNDASVFDRNENLRKKIEKYADGAPQPKIDAEMQRRLLAIFEPRRKIAYSEIIALPKIEDIKTSGGRLLIVLSPDKKIPPEDAERLFKSVVEKNNFSILTGDGSDLAKLEDKVRRIWAVAKVKDEEGGDKSPNGPELNEEAELAEFEFSSTLTALFNRILLSRKAPEGSVASGVSTAKKLLEGRPLDDEEFELSLDDGKLDIIAEERLHLQTIIDSFAVDESDPKLDAVLFYLRERHWLEFGCIVFSQYYDTVKWIGQSLTARLPGETVAVYAGSGKSGLFINGEWKSVLREEIKKAVKERRIRLVIATDAACEGLNLQTLGTLIDIDLPWNPSRLEQRIGRIKRFGQMRDKVDMANLVYHATLDEKVYETLSSRMQDRYNIFGTLPDVIRDDWIDDIEDLEKKLHEFTTKKGQAKNAFDLRYASDVTDDANRWELCERVLARPDVTKRLSLGWGERLEKAA